MVNWQRVFVSISFVILCIFLVYYFFSAGKIGMAIKEQNLIRNDCVQLCEEHNSELDVYGTKYYADQFSLIQDNYLEPLSNNHNFYVCQCIDTYTYVLRPINTTIYKVN